MSLKALIDLANERSLPRTPEEEAERNKAFQERMREYDKAISARIKASEPSQALLNRMITI